MSLKETITQKKRRKWTRIFKNPKRLGAEAYTSNPSYSEGRRGRIKVPLVQAKNN
jgi:hypothetical protein